MAVWLRFVRLLPLLVGGALLVWHSLRYNFVTDDAYISFVFSRNFAEHGELTFNLGDRTEGYTNFLWTFVLGVLMVVGINPELSSRVLSTACALGTLWQTFRGMRLVLPAALPSRDVWAGLPALLLGASSGFACWTSGGLETQLFTFLVAWAVVEYVALPQAAVVSRSWRKIGVAFALAAMTRPEGPMLAALVGVHALACNVFGSRRWLPTRAQWDGAAAFLLVWAPWFAWRWWYYGWPFPNTYYVKAHGPWASPHMARIMWNNGWYYLWVWVQQALLLWLAPLWVLGMVSAWAQGEARAARLQQRLVVVLLLIVGFYVPYVASVGGDFMGLHRFIMPLFVIAALLVALGIVSAVQLLAAASSPTATSRFGHSLFGGWLAIGVIAAVVGHQQQLTNRSLRWGNFANDRGIDSPRFLITYTEDRAAIGRAMASCFVASDVSIVGGAGAQPYFGRMRAYDVFGLVSEPVAHLAPRSNPRAGHTKWGDDALLAKTYDPTFVFSCYAISAKPQVGPLPCGGYWRAHGYEQVTMHVPGMRERGEYYTFLVKQSRGFTCPGRVSEAPATAPTTPAH